MELPELRDTPGGGMEVMDADGVWRTVPFALQEFFRSFRPADGFTVWEWMIGQVFSAGMFPKDGLGPNTPDSAFELSRRFKETYSERFPEETEKFARYMGWKKD